MATLTEIDVGKILQEKCVITIRVKMPIGWKWRFRLASWLIAIAARIAGLGYGGLVDESESA